MNFEDKVKQLFDEHEVLLSRRNEPQEKKTALSPVISIRY